MLYILTWVLIVNLNRVWLADTLALMSFTIVTGMFIEVVVAGMTLQQSLISRLLCQPVNILTGRLYGRYRDRVIRALPCQGPRWLNSALGDVLAYISFQLPLYVLILLGIGMNMSEIVTAAVSQTLSLGVLGAPYGVWLTQTRRWIKVAPQEAT